MIQLQYYMRLVEEYITIMRYDRSDNPPRDISCSGKKAIQENLRQQAESTFFRWTLETAGANRRLLPHPSLVKTWFNKIASGVGFFYTPSPVLYFLPRRLSVVFSLLRSLLFQFVTIKISIPFTLAYCLHEDFWICRFCLSS